MNYKKAKMDSFLREFERSHWNITKACKAIGLDRRTYYDWLKHCPKFREKLNEQQEAILDKAESVLHKQLDDDNVSVAQYILEKRGKRRGYGPQEMAHSGNLKLEIVKRTIDGNGDVDDA